MPRATAFPSALGTVEDGRGGDRRGPIQCVNCSGSGTWHARIHRRVISKPLGNEAAGDGRPTCIPDHQVLPTATFLLPQLDIDESPSSSTLALWYQLCREQRNNLESLVANCNRMLVGCCQCVGNLYLYVQG